MADLNPKRVNAITIRFDDSEWHDASTGAAACDRSLSDFEPSGFGPGMGVGEPR